MSLSGILAVLTLAAVALSPQLVRPKGSAATLLTLSTVWIGSLALAIGYGCAYLEGVLRSALAGGAAGIEVPDLSPRAAVLAFARWTLCFLAGPAVLIYFAVRHILQCTSITAVDALIVINLVVTAISYWVIELIAVNGGSQIAPPAPQQILNVLRQLNWRAYLAGLAAVVAGIVYAALGASVIWLSAGPWTVCLALVWLWWFSAWECSAFILRTVGFWHCRGRSGTAVAADRHPAM